MAGHRLASMVERVEPQTTDLVALARSGFGEWSEAEQRLLRGAAMGRVASCGPSPDDLDPANDPAKVDAWGPERQIRSGLIRWLCIHREAASSVDPRGLQVRHAR